MYDHDPKWAPTKTVRRADLAARRIPRFVRDLRWGNQALTVDNIDMLYREYRAFFRSNRPFRLDQHHVSVPCDEFADETIGKLLARLKEPHKIGKRQALAVLLALRAAVLTEATTKKCALA